MSKEFNLRRLGLFTSKTCRSPKGTSAAVHPKVCYPENVCLWTNSSELRCMGKSSRFYITYNKSIIEPCNKYSPLWLSITCMNWYKVLYMDYYYLFHLARHFLFQGFHCFQNKKKNDSNTHWLKVHTCIYIKSTKNSNRYYWKNILKTSEALTLILSMNEGGSSFE